MCPVQNKPRDSYQPYYLILVFLVALFTSATALAEFRLEDKGTKVADLSVEPDGVDPIGADDEYEDDEEIAGGYEDEEYEYEDEEGDEYAEEDDLADPLEDYDLGEEESDVAATPTDRAPAAANPNADDDLPDLPVFDENEEKQPEKLKTAAKAPVDDDEYYDDEDGEYDDEGGAADTSPDLPPELAEAINGEVPQEEYEDEYEEEQVAERPAPRRPRAASVLPVGAPQGPDPIPIKITKTRSGKALIRYLRRYDIDLEEGRWYQLVPLKKDFQLKKAQSGNDSAE